MFKLSPRTILCITEMMSWCIHFYACNDHSIVRKKVQMKISFSSQKHSGKATKDSKVCCPICKCDNRYLLKQMPNDCNWYWESRVISFGFPPSHNIIPVGFLFHLPIACGWSEAERSCFDDKMCKVLQTTNYATQNRNFICWHVHKGLFVKHFWNNIFFWFFFQFQKEILTLT